MFKKNKEKFAVINDNIDYLFMKNTQRATEIKELRIQNEKLRKDLDTLRDLMVISSELDSNNIKEVDKKYKSVFTLLLDKLKLNLDLNDEGEMCLRGKPNNKTKTKTVKVDKKNNSVRSKANKKRK